MELGLKDKVAIVTGAGQGIGEAIALALAKEGVKIVVNDVNMNNARRVVEAIKREGGQALPIKADVSKYGQVTKLVEATLEEFGRIDILVNNAGIHIGGLLLEMEEKDWKKVLDVNLTGIFLCSKAVSKVMMKQRSGKIINAASFAGIMPSIEVGAYAVSKAGVFTLTKVLAAELAPYNITVNAYLPGVVETPMTEAGRKKFGRKMLAPIALGRFGKPQEVAELVVFLASEAASYLTGTAVEITGGKYISQNQWLAYEKARGKGKGG